MKVLKKIKSNASITILILFITVGLSAQSTIGVPMPPFKTPAFSNFPMIHFDLNRQIIEVNPFIYTDTYIRPAAFNSPLLDNVLTAFAEINQFNQSPMPFFCKIEFQMEQASGFPVRFRLGDVNFVDRLESKKDWELGN